MAADGTRRTAPCRLLMTADTIGGVWTYALELCRALRSSGHEIALATMGRLPDRAQRREAMAIPGLELHASPHRLIWMDEPWRDIEAAADWLSGLAAAVRPDVVHLNDLGHAHLAWPAPTLVVVHSCVLSWWRAVHATAAPAAWDRYAAHVRRGLAGARLVVAPTRAMLAEAVRHYGPLPATQVIANARSQPRRVRVAREPIVLSAGRLWDEGKNVAMLARIAPRLAWPVWLAGPDRAPDGARFMPSNVKLLGRLGAQALRRHYARASIYALPARYEPFGLSVLEAAQAGCALALGEIASLRENWDGAALFAPPNDAEAFAAMLERLIADDTLRVRLGTRARARAAAFAPEAMAAAYAQAYASLTMTVPDATGRGGGAR